MQTFRKIPKFASNALALGLAASLLAGPAMAGSIDPVETGKDDVTSVVAVGCQTCPPLKPVERKDDYVVRDLEPGTQTVEIKEIDGKMKVVRTEAWLGGSPIVFITSLPGQEKGASDIAEQDMPPALDEAAGKVPEIDASTTTSAVNASMTDDAKPEVKAAPVFDPGQLQLRAN